jgi:outer membrane protein OmpA-like peptidoglycan-associated protein
MKLRSLLLGTAVALGSAGAAHADVTTPTGWYISLAGGANWIEDGNIDEFSTGVLTTPNEYSYDTGYIVSGAVGYDFGRWRIEFENTFRHNDVSGFIESSTDPETAPGAEVWELSQMVNALYDIEVSGRFSASVGAGIGGNLVVFTPDTNGNFDGSAAGLETDDYVLAGQLIAQLAYDLTERWKVYLDYRYTIMEDPELDDPTDFAELWEMEKTEHSVLVGFRFDLQRDGAPPPPKAEVPPPAKAPKQFIVFFGFNKSNLTPEAARVVADAAAAAKEYGSASIIVVGHTDTVGSPRYNNALSLRRSHAVKDGLVSNGIPAAAISTAGKGESELMVQTGDSVKEPQNRRATIDLN